MNKISSFQTLVSCCFLFLFTTTAVAQDGAVRAVQVYAETQNSPPQITLQWEESPHPVSHIYIHRRAPGTTTWVYQANDPAPADTQWVDTGVEAGVRYEYRVARFYESDFSTFNARGYTIAGIQAPLIDQRGTVVLLVDETQAEPLSEEIDRFVRDLMGDGWHVIQDSAHPNDLPTSVRAKLQTHYNADPSGVKAAILLGRIPVPYSGDIAPDGHSDHKGAWPADTYYADLTGTWSDTTVNTTSASSARNHNVPGDGNFDQSSLPEDANIAIGRIDMANLNDFGAGANETELLRNYLRKNHEFRHRLGYYAYLPRRALIRDAFGVLSGNNETPASMAWRAFAPMFGRDQVTASANWFPTVESEAYLWGYGGGGSGYTSIGGVGSSTDFKTKTSLVVFNAFFGSYFGDWDSPVDNVLRAPLAGAMDSMGLVSVWATRPDWYLHGMSLGETMGEAYLRTVNNPNDWGDNWWTGYFNWVNNTQRSVHIALMGDPTLRLHPVSAPVSGTYVREGSAVQLDWQAPANEPDLVGYHVYRATSLEGPYTRLTTAPVATTSYADASAPAGSVYQVRTVALTESASGSYYNAGQALFLEEGPGVIEFTQAVFEVMEPVFVAGDSSTSTKTVTISVRRAGGGAGEVSVAHVAAALESLSFAGENYSSGGIGYHQEFQSNRPEITASKGFLTWADGETGEKSFSFEIYADSTWEDFVGSPNPLVEGIESLFLFLGQPRGGAVLGDNARARLDILDAEAPAGGQGVIQFERPRFSAMENAGHMEVVLRRVQGSNGAVSATFNTSSSMVSSYLGLTNPITAAQPGSDYTSVNQVVTWADGDSEDKIVQVPLIDNDTVQSSGTRGVRGIRFQLSSPTGGAEVSVNESLGLIIDNESQIFDLWIENLWGKRIAVRLPTNTPVPRGLIHFMPGTGGDWRGQILSASHQAVADQWGFAISGQLANAFADSTPGGIAKFHNQMDALALFSGRDELRNVPVIFTGISAGGYACTDSHGSVPEQVLGFVAHKGGGYAFHVPPLSDGKTPIHESNLFTPGLLISGGNDGTVTAKNLYDALDRYRTFLPPGSQMSTAVDWNIGHTDNGGQGWAMAYLFMDELIRLRYPQGQVPGTGFGEFVDLKNIPHAETWLVEQVNTFNGNGTPTAGTASANLQIRPAAGVEDPGDDGVVISERIARALQAFSSLASASYPGAMPFQSPLKITSHTTTSSQITSVNLGESTTVNVDPRGYVNFNRMDFYFNNNLVGTKTEAPWTVTFTPEQSGVGLLRVETSTNGGGEIRYAFETVLVKGEGDLEPAAPQILTQPLSQNVVQGANVGFSVVASGMPAPAYQWRKNGVELPGANAAVLNLSAVTLADAGNYDVVVSNSEGTVESALATLEVQATGTHLIVHETFSPQSLSWSRTGGTFDVVTDSTLDPDSPHAVGELSMDTADKDEYLYFPLPSEIALEVGEAIRLSFKLRHTGAPRDDNSRTGFSLAHTPGNSPWSNAANKEYWVRTSYGNGANLGSIRKTDGAQLLNVETVLQDGTRSINAGTNVIEAWLEVMRLNENEVRIRYRLDDHPVEEVVDSEEIITAFNRVFFRFRTRADSAEPQFHIDEVKVEHIITDTGPFSARINFISEAGASNTPEGWVSDTGAVFGDRGNGLFYGWNADNSGSARLRNGWTSENVKEYSLLHLQQNGNFSWEIALPNGHYHVRIVSGDPTAFDSAFRIAAEEVLVVNGDPTTDNRWVEGIATVEVTDGRLTLTNAEDASNNKICFIEIDPVAGDVTADVTLGNLAQSYNATERSASVNTVPPGLTVEVTYNGSPTPPVNAGSYMVLATVTEPGYVGSAEETLVISPASLTVTADAQSKIEGEADPVLTWQITSGELFGSDALSGTLSRDPGEAPGDYAIQQGSLTAGANYTLNFVGAIFTITPAPSGDFTLTFEAPSVDESAGSINVTVTRDTLAGDQVVLLHSNDTRLTPPASVIIPDGQYSHTFAVTLSGPASETPVQLTATAPAARVGESFAGALDTEVTGQETGWGWGGAWYHANASPVLVEPALTYAQNGTIGTSGTRAAKLVDVGAGGDARRNFPEKYSTGSIWVSTLLYRNSGNWGTQMIIRENTSGGNWARVRYANNTDFWILEAGTGNSVQLLGANPSPTTFFAVMEFDFTARKVRAWLNPDVSGASPANALASGEVDMQEALTGISRLDIAGFSNLDQFDEIRVATSFADLYAVETASDSLLITGEFDTETPFVFFESGDELTQNFRVNHGTATLQATGGIDNSGALVTSGNPQLLLRSRVFDPSDANALGVHVRIGEQANSGYDSVTAMLGFATSPTMNFQGGASDPNVYVAGRLLNLSNNGGYRLEILNKTATDSAQSTVAAGDTFALDNNSWIYVRLRLGPNASELTLDLFESNASGEIGERLQSLDSPVSNPVVANDARLWAVLRARRDGNAALMDNFAASEGAPAPSPMRTFVMAGQSNAVGYRSNDRNALPELIRNGVPGVRGAWLVANKNGDTLAPYASNGWNPLDVQNVGTTNGPFWPNAEGFGPEITLSHRLQTHYGEDIALMKFAVNGASLFQNFDPANNDTSAYYNDLRDYLLARRTELEIIEDREASLEAFFWLQGESDASSNSPQPESAEGYAANLAAFLSQIRSDLHAPELFFVASHINPRSAAFTAENVAKVNNALMAAAADPFARVAPSADLWPAGGDDIHFNSPQTMEIGERLADAYLKTPATVSLNDLTQTVDGTGKSPTITTTPAGLNVVSRFDGSPALPTTSNRYETLVRIEDETHAGFALATFTLLTSEGFVDSNDSGADDEWEMATFGNLNDEPVEINGTLYTRRQVFVWGLENPLTQIFLIEDFGFSTVTGRVYDVYYNDDLRDPDGWTPLVGQQNLSTETPGIIVIQDPDPAPVRAYRIQVRMP
ncbi:MAG: immunoglobulin domain-containing protein [Verrucomicrobia bacterium]|nr:immunoglobulin domain-containing protein [Verrucomicrobiota bacterium]MCH8512533.1 MBG domain-containing protein [Kiritimatiellia bacterium]